MLLRSMLLDGERVVEQVLFTSIEYPERIDPARFEVAVDEERMSWLEPARARARAGEVPGVGWPGRGRWLVRRTRGEGRAAKGAAAKGRRPLRGATGRLRRAVGKRRTDERGRGADDPRHGVRRHGLGVSVYVDRAAPDEQDLSVAGLSSMGAMNAYGLSLEGGFVTVVGEVPPATVRAIAKAVRLDE